MRLTNEERTQIANELKAFGTSMNLSEDQKTTLQGYLTEAHERVQAYRQDNPNASREDLATKIADNRAGIRERLVQLLTPDQLSKWDAEIAKAKDLLRHTVANGQAGVESL